MNVYTILTGKLTEETRRDVKSVRSGNNKVDRTILACGNVDWLGRRHVPAA